MSKFATNQQPRCYRSVRTAYSIRYVAVACLYWFVLLVCCRATPAVAQQKMPAFRSLSQEQGLSNNAVTCVYQDRAGFMWIGTRSGLNRFDGYDLQVYSKQGEGSNFIPRDNIYDIQEDAQGQLLVITLNGALLRLDSATHRFGPFFTPDENRRYGFDHISFIRAYVDRQGIVWLSTLQHGLIAFDETHRMPRFFTTKSLPAIASNNVVTVMEDSQHQLWVGTDAGITTISPDRKSSRQLLPGNALANDDANHINAFFEDRLNQIWIATGRGLFMHRADDTDLIPLLTNGQPLGVVRSLQDDLSGNVWIGTDDGLLIFDLQKHTFTPVPTNPTQRFALNDQYVFSICRDRQGNMWVGTYYGGVNINYATTAGFAVLPDPRAHNALNGKIIRDIVEDKWGNRWFGLENSGVVGLMHNSAEIKTLTTSPSTENGLLGNQIQGLDDDADGNLWIGSYNRGVNKYDPRTGRITHFSHEPGNNNSLSSNAVNNILVDRKGRVWIGTNLGGLNRYDAQTGHFRHYRHSSRAGSLGNDQVATLYEDAKGQLWIGTVTGLNRYDEWRDQFVQYPRLNQSVSAAGLYVTAIFEDHQSTLWVGSAGDGLFALTPKTGQFRSVRPDRQLANATVYKVLEDRGGQLWFGSNTGLYKYDALTNHYVNFTISDGLVANQFNYNAGCALKNGQLMFGLVNGYTLFDPVRLQKPDYKPVLAITDFRANDRPASAVSDPKMSAPPSVQLAHDQSTLHIRFVALEYGSYDNKLYTYKLEGYDDVWSVPSKNRVATYTRLPHGQYRFLVRATSNKGNWVAAATPILVTIRPPWWQTTWAYLGYALLSAGFVYCLGRYSIIEINRKNQLLIERLDREREREMSAMKYRFFTNVSHEFRTPLTLIKAPLDELMAQTQVVNQYQSTRQLVLMDQQVSKMVRLVDQLMDVSKSEAGHLKLQLEAVDLVPLCGQIVGQFEAMATQQLITLRFQSLANRFVRWADADKLEKVVYNLLTNALKYTPAHGSIMVQLSGGDDHKPVMITVTDTGIGIPLAALPRVFDRFYQADNQQFAAHRGTGIGLALCRDLVELHGGTIIARSQPLAGSQFIVTLPLTTAETPAITLYSHADTPREEGVAILPPVPVTGCKPTVLVVEDNLDIQAYLRELLLPTYNVVCRDNGQVAWTYLEEHLPDLIVSDVMMPLVDGILFCRQVKSNLTTCHLPVLMLTARGTDTDQISGLATGADDYITKPFNPQVLLLRLQNLLANRQLIKDKFRRELLLEPQGLTTDSLDEIFLKKAMAVTEANVENPNFTAQVLAEFMNMSRSAFYRKLQAITDLTPGDFIRNVRLKRAAQLLQQHELSVSAVAFAVGYNDLKTFRQNFQQQYGTTPANWSKKAQLS